LTQALEDALDIEPQTAFMRAVFKTIPLLSSLCAIFRRIAGVVAAFLCKAIITRIVSAAAVGSLGSR
jgi:hypothetical protein